jgi:hypothetical protein
VKAVVALAPVNQSHKDHLLAHAGELSVPVLVEAGESDWLATHEYTRGIYDRATSSPERQLIVIKSGGHNLYQDGSKKSSQHAIASRYATAWFEKFLGGAADPEGYTTGRAAAAYKASRALSDFAADSPAPSERAPSATPGLAGALGDAGR